MSETTHLYRLGPEQITTKSQQEIEAELAQWRFRESLEAEICFEAWF